MPESLVIAFNQREIENPPPVRLARVAGRSLPVDGINMHGTFVIHPDICAKVDGERQTVSIHPCGPQDPFFAALPSPRRVQGRLESCISCNTVAFDDEDIPHSDASQDTEKISPEQGDILPQSIAQLQGLPAAEIVNGLDITGDLRSVCRGKELVIAVDCYAIRIGYALEAHSFWIPTTVYRKIINSTPVLRGKKSKTFVIPPEIFDGPSETVGQISIQAAFVCPDWTLIFVDHNVMITFHIMALHHPISKADLEPSSKIWPLLWSSKHGPVYSKEPDECDATLERWRASCASNKDDTPIFLSVKAEQRVFNGFGAQETCDMLFRAMISPIMPTYFICQNSSLWLRFKTAVIQHQLHCLKLLHEESFPYVSGARPFIMRHDAHKRFLKHVSTYRRKYVTVDQETLTLIHGFGLLDPAKTIDTDGVAKDLPHQSLMYAYSHVPKAVPTTVRVNRLRLPNYMVTFRPGKTSTKSINTYTPFTAQMTSDWWPVLKWAPVDVDVNQVLNSTTLGPYSFQVFVAAGWTAKKVQKVPTGRRPLTVTDTARRKRPLASQIAKTSQRGVKKNSSNILYSVDENSIPEQELGTRALRSGKKISL